MGRKINKSLLATTLCLLTILSASCDNDYLADFSKSQIQYRVVSLNDSVRRPIIQAQFDAAKQSISTANSLPKTIQQSDLVWDYFDAIRGATVDKDQLIKDGYYGGGLNDGELGLVMTTTNLIVPFAEALPADAILVTLEDDVIIPIDVDLSFRFALKQVPNNWDMLFLGCFQGALNNPPGVVHGPFYPQNLSNEEGFTGQLCNERTVTRVPGTPWVKLTVGCDPGTWAYALRASSARKINVLFGSSKPFSKPIDNIYTSFFNGRINAYCLNPELIRPNYALPSFLR